MWTNHQSKDTRVGKLLHLFVNLWAELKKKKGRAPINWRQVFLETQLTTQRWYKNKMLSKQKVQQARINCVQLKFSQRFYDEKVFVATPLFCHFSVLFYPLPLSSLSSCFPGSSLSCLLFSPSHSYLSLFSLPLSISSILSFGHESEDLMQNYRKTKEVKSNWIMMELQNRALWRKRRS